MSDITKEWDLFFFFSFCIDMKNKQTLSVSRFCWSCFFIFSLSICLHSDQTTLTVHWFWWKWQVLFIPSLQLFLAYSSPFSTLPPGCCKNKHNHNPWAKIRNLKSSMLDDFRSLWGPWIIDKELCLWLFYFRGETSVFYHILETVCDIPHY